MNLDPAVSIVMAAYNATKFIEASLKTSLAQTYQNYNIIVVDDGSTDDTNKIVKEMAEKNPKLKLITMPRNRGQFFARSLALKEASEFVMFQDADDDLTPDIVEVAVRKQLETKADVVYFRTKILDVASGALFPHPTNAGLMFP